MTCMSIFCSSYDTMLCFCMLHSRKGIKGGCGKRQSTLPARSDTFTPSETSVISPEPSMSRIVISLERRSVARVSLAFVERGICMASFSKPHRWIRAEKNKISNVGIKSTAVKGKCSTETTLFTFTDTQSANVLLFTCSKLRELFGVLSHEMFTELHSRLSSWNKYLIINISDG